MERRSEFLSLGRARNVPRKIFTQISRRSSFISPQYRFEPRHPRSLVCHWNFYRHPAKFRRHESRPRRRENSREPSAPVSSCGAEAVRRIFWRMPRICDFCRLARRLNKLPQMLQKTKLLKNLNRGLFLYPSGIKSEGGREREGIRYADYVSRNGTRAWEGARSSLVNPVVQYFRFDLN